MSDALDIDAYFRRVGYAGAGTPNLATLEDLHALHAAAIPFENLSPFLGEPAAGPVLILVDSINSVRSMVIEPSGGRDLST